MKWETKRIQQQQKKTHSVKEVCVLAVFRFDIFIKSCLAMTSSLIFSFIIYVKWFLCVCVFFLFLLLLLLFRYSHSVLQQTNMVCFFVSHSFSISFCRGLHMSACILRSVEIWCEHSTSRRLPFLVCLFFFLLISFAVDVHLAHEPAVLFVLVQLDRA